MWSVALNVYALMQWRVSALFRFDADGRLLTTNELEAPPAPRLFVGRTAEGNVWRFRHDVPPTLARDLDRLLAAEPPATDFLQPPVCSQHLQEMLASHAPIISVASGPAWWCPEGIAPPRAIATTRLTDGAVCARTLPWLAEEFAHWQPCVAALEGGEAVAVCFGSRVSSRVVEAGAFTLEEYRGRGYAPATVAAWASAVRETGRIPLYSTSWDNHASQAVARKLGLVLYGTDFSIS